MNHHLVGSESHGLLILLRQMVRAVPIPRQRRPTPTKVSHLVAIAQQTLQLSGIAIHLPIFNAKTVCHAITYACHLYGSTGWLPIRRKQLSHQRPQQGHHSHQRQKTLVHTTNSLKSR